MSEQEILSGLWEASVCFVDGERAEVEVSPPFPDRLQANDWAIVRIIESGREGYVVAVRQTSQMPLL